MMKDDFTLLFYAFFLIWALGTLFRRLVARKETLFLGFSQWAVDFGLGMVLISFWLLLSFQLLGRIYFQSIYYLLFIFLFLVITRDKKEFFKDFTFRIHHLSELKNLDLYSVLLWIFLAQILWFVWWGSYYMPLAYDTWYGYGFLAKAFYIDKSIHTEFMFETGPHIFSIVFYRYLLSMTGAWIFYILGGTWNQVHSFMTFVFYLGILSLLYYAAKQFVSPFLALLVTLLISALEQAMNLASTGMADLVIAFYIFAGCLFFYRWLETRSRSILLLSAIFFVGGVLTKNEGISMAVIAIFVLWLYVLVHLRDKMNRKVITNHALSFTGILIVGFIPWVLIYIQALTHHITHHALPIQNRLLTGVRLQMIWQAFNKEWINLDTWGLVWAFAALGLGYMIVQWSKGKYKTFRWIWLLVGLQGLSYFLVLYTNRGDLGYFLSKTPFRLLFQITPVLVYLSLVPWKKEES